MMTAVGRLAGRGTSATRSLLRRAARRCRSTLDAASVRASAGKRVAELDDGVVGDLNERGLEPVGRDQFFLTLIREKPHFDKDGGHVGRFKDAQRRAIAGMRRERHPV